MPQPARRRRYLGGLGKVVRPPIAAAASSASFARPGTHIPGYGLPGGIKHFVTGGMPFQSDPHRQPTAFTSIGPGSVSSPAAAGPGRAFLRSQRRPRRLHGLGAISPDAAAQFAMPQSSISKKAGFTQAVYDGIVQAASSGQFNGFNPSGCKGVNFAKPALVATAGGFALKFAGATGPFAPVLLVAGAALQVFGAIFAHHAAAVQKERQVLCAEVPAAADSLSVIDQGVQSGQISPQQGAASLDQLLADFTQQVRSIVKMDASQCNAACTWTKQLIAIVAKKKADYADLASGSSESLTTTLASTGLPPWALAAAAFGVLWMLL